MTNERGRAHQGKAFAEIDVQYEVNGLESLREFRDATGQPRPHSHNEVEILLIEQGSGTWFLGGEIVTLRAGRLTVFWAVRPHQLLKSSRKMVVNCLTIPLAVFNEWQLPERFSKALLAGQTLLEPDPGQFNMDKRPSAIGTRTSNQTTGIGTRLRCWKSRPAWGAWPAVCPT